MQVIKRNGAFEDVQFDKILYRVKAVAKDLSVDPVVVSQKVVSGLFDKIKSSEIDTLLAETAAVMATEHPDYSKLASRIAISNLHKQTKGFYQTMKDLYKAGNISSEFIKTLRSYGKDIDKYVKYEKDYDFTYFAFKTLERGYLLKINGQVVERPQHLFMRVALTLGDNLEEVLDLYELMSQGMYTHATPTLFNAGTPHPQLSSCYLLGMNDSLDSIYTALGECAQISKFAGGIGIHVSNIRARGSYIRGTAGVSSGIVPMLKVFNATATYVDQCGKRKGSIAVYLEPWHADVEDFVVLKKNTGKDEMRCRDLFLALWTPNLFMERVKSDGVWSLMCPYECPGLTDTYGTEFEKLYCRYEEEGKFKKQIRARDLMTLIAECQIETGVPYIMFKDFANEKSNQKNLGVIKSSNLCSEIVEYSDANNHAVCNLGSICLPKYVKDNSFNFELLKEVSKKATKYLNKVIDKTFYPSKKTQATNLAHRPIGLGVQGLADVFFMLDLPFDSEEAAALNRDIFETIYYGAVEASCELAESMGSYSSYEGSPASRGQLQFDLWGVKPTKYDWDKLKSKIKKHGLRNSLLIAPMPTASTAQIFDNIEAFEAQTSNLYKREVLSGEFLIVNKHLIKKLEELSLWNSEMRDKIISGNGSVQHIEEIPEHIRSVYRTVWELSQRTIIDLAADRGPYICQSQSMNLFLDNPNVAKIASMIMYSYTKKLKTGSYYIRSKPALNAQKVTTKIDMTPQEQLSCSLENPENCVACSA